MVDAVRRLNHWVPASYLAPFTATGKADDNLTAYRRDSPRRKLVLPPRALAREKDLYVVEAPEGRRDDSVERLLAERIEGPFIPVRNHLAFGYRVGLTGKLLPEEEDALALFIAFQQVRTPKFREQFNLLATFQGNFLARAMFQNIHRVKADLEHLHQRPFSVKEVREMRRDFEKERLRVEPNDKLWLVHALQLAEDMAPVIRSLPRAIFRAPDAVLLPTNDTPVVLVRRRSQIEFRHGGGWLQENAEMTFPLSPTTVLVIGNALKTYADQGTDSWFEQVRKRIASAADQWLFTVKGDAELAEVLWSTEAPRTVIDYPGGRIMPGESIYAAVRHMMETNPGEAFLRFGPEA